jgi:hypothetical protein
MEAILKLHVEMLEVQREELTKRILAEHAMRDFETPQINTKLYMVLSQLANLANVPSPDQDFVKKSEMDLSHWIRTDFVQGITRQVLESLKSVKE